MKPTTNKITPEGRKMIFALLHKAEKYHTRKEYLEDLIGVSSINDLTQDQAREVATDLQREINRQYHAKGFMGRKIIHLLCEYGMVIDTKPDYNRINKFISEIGSRNPRKEQLWGLNYDEMHAVLNQVELMHKKEVMGD